MLTAEESARARKAAALVAALSDRARIEAPDAPPFRQFSLALAFAHDAGRAGSETWEAWARTADVRPPSDDTIALVCDQLGRLASPPRNAEPGSPDDPFVGLD